MDLFLVVSCLFISSRQLGVGSYYYYYCLCNRQQWPGIKVEGVGSLLLASQLGETSNCLKHNTYMYILYLRHEDANLYNSVHGSSLACICDNSHLIVVYH